MKKIYIKKAIIGGAFLDCNNLKEIKVAKGNKVYDSRNGCNAIIETKTNTLIIGCNNTKIPETVEIIGEYAFACCEKLKEIEIPSSVKEIGYCAFWNCTKLRNITIPSEVNTIDAFAFESCENVNY